MEAPFKSSTLFGFSVKHHPFWIPPFIENPMCISERGIHRGFGLFSISDDLSELSQKKTGEYMVIMNRWIWSVLRSWTLRGIGANEPTK